MSLRTLVAAAESALLELNTDRENLQVIILALCSEVLDEDDVIDARENLVRQAHAGTPAGLSASDVKAMVRASASAIRTGFAFEAIDFDVLTQLINSQVAASRAALTDAGKET